MKSPEINMQRQNARPHFSLKSLLVAVAGFSVLCIFSFVLVPELWSLVTETPSVRKGLVGILDLAVA